MPRHALTSLPLLLALLLIASDALAQTPMQRQTMRLSAQQIGVQTGTVTTGGISGRRGTDVVTLTRGDDTILSALYVGDGINQNPEVCYIQAHFWKKDSPSASFRKLKRRFDLCNPQLGRDPQPGQVRFHNIGYQPGGGGDHNPYQGDSFRAARGIQTCSTSGVPYIHDQSIVFHEADVDSDGDMTPNTYVTNLLLNGQYGACRDNRNAARMCPSGQVVVGVDVHYRRSGTKVRVLGLAPKCAPITVSYGSSLRTAN